MFSCNYNLAENDHDAFSEALTNRYRFCDVKICMGIVLFSVLTPLQLNLGKQ
jgi:hypothetical protein